MYFQDVILELNKFWARKGCVMVQPYDLEVGAGTFHHFTTLKALGPEPWPAALALPRMRAQFQCLDGNGPGPVAQAGLLAALCRRAGARADGEGGGGARGCSSDHEFSLAAPVPARRDEPP